jgi:hypothetical protein
MNLIEIDDVVKNAVGKIKDSDIQSAKAQIEVQIDGRAWNMNRPLNMIAYEDQK